MPFPCRESIQMVHPIIQQPTHIDNVFTITSGENVLQTYECDQKYVDVVRFIQ